MAAAYTNLSSIRRLAYRQSTAPVGCEAFCWTQFAEFSVRHRQPISAIATPSPRAAPYAFCTILPRPKGATPWNVVRDEFPNNSRPDTLHIPFLWHQLRQTLRLPGTHLEPLSQNRGRDTSVTKQKLSLPRCLYASSSHHIKPTLNHITSTSRCPDS